MTIKVNKARCPENHPCPAIRVCPVGAMTQKGFLAPEIDQGKCIDCGRCTAFCPLGAIALGNG